MTRYVWDDLLSERDKDVIKAAGYEERGASSWESRGEGDSPALLVIDMQRLTVGNDVPILDAIEESRIAMGEVAWDALEHITSVLSFARDRETPVIYTRVVPQSYDDPSHPDLSIVDEVAPRPEDDIVDKNYASAFYGTDLLTILVSQGIDSLVVVGNTTSGCLRATVVDAQQHGFNVILPQECTFDRIEASHKIGLLDMWMKYANVVEVEEAKTLIDRMVSK